MQDASRQQRDRGRRPCLRGPFWALLTLALDTSEMPTPSCRRRDRERTSTVAGESCQHASAAPLQLPTAASGPAPSGPHTGPGWMRRGSPDSEGRTDAASPCQPGPWHAQAAGPLPSLARVRTRTRTHPLTVVGMMAKMARPVANSRGSNGRPRTAQDMAGVMPTMDSAAKPTASAPLPTGQHQGGMEGGGAAGCT